MTELQTADPSLEDGLQPSGARRGALPTLGLHWGGYVVQIATLVVLTRFLLPADFGVIAMATSVIGVAAVLGDFGLSLAALRADSLTREQKSTLFRLNVALGAVISALVAAAAPLLALFYRQPLLLPVTTVLGSVFLLNGCGVQFKVELNRQGRFGALGGSELAAQGSSFVAAAVAALCGAGPWALVVQQVTNAVVGAALAVVLCRWRPGRAAPLAEVRSMLAFGRDSILLQVVNYAATNADSVSLGRAQGAGSLGFYNRSYQLATAPVVQVLGPLTRVFVPRLAAARTADEFAGLVHRVQTTVGYAILLPLSLLACTSDSVPVLVFGGRWAQVAPIVDVLAVGTAFMGLAYVYYWACAARGRMMRLFLSEMPGRVVIIAGAVATAPLGPVPVGLAVAAGQALMWICATFTLGPGLGLRPRRLLAASSRPLLLALAVTAGGFAGGRLLGPAPAPLVHTAIELAGWIVVAAVLLGLHPGIRSDLRGVARSLLARGQRSGTAER